MDPTATFQAIATATPAPGISIAIDNTAVLIGGASLFLSLFVPGVLAVFAAWYNRSAIERSGKQTLVSQRVLAQDEAGRQWRQRLIDPLSAYAKKRVADYVGFARKTYPSTEALTAAIDALSPTSMS